MVDPTTGGEHAAEEAEGFEFGDAARSHECPRASEGHEVRQGDVRGCEPLVQPTLDPGHLCAARGAGLQEARGSQPFQPEGNGCVSETDAGVEGRQSHRSPRRHFQRTRGTG